MYAKHLKYLIVWKGRTIENALLENALDVLKTITSKFIHFYKNHIKSVKISFLHGMPPLHSWNIIQSINQSIKLMEWGKDKTSDWQLLWEKR